MQGNPPTDGVAHENALVNTNSVKQLYHERGIVLHRPDPCRWLAFLPAGQLGHISEGNGTQRPRSLGAAASRLAPLTGEAWADEGRGPAALAWPKCDPTGGGRV